MRVLHSSLYIKQNVSIDLKYYGDVLFYMLNFILYFCSFVISIFSFFV